MRRTRLARAALTALAISVPTAGLAVGATAGTASAAVAWQAQQKPIVIEGRHRGPFNQHVAAYVRHLEGVPYVYGGTTRAGFDCSGLTQYVYRHYRKRIERTADEQFREFRRISRARAWPGDLVFFHVDSDSGSYVYHVGVYEGGGHMVAASSGARRVIWESFAWAGDTVTFGTITHR